jgi:hypothetical protein
MCMLLALGSVRIRQTADAWRLKLLANPRRRYSWGLFCKDLCSVCGTKVYVGIDPAALFNCNAMQMFVRQRCRALRHSLRS